MAANLRLEELNATDALTGLANRRGYTDFLEREWLRAVRAQTSIGAAMVDVDFFKGYNDRYGHPAGDACLRAIANTLRVSVRHGVDLVARYGGEEFVILLPGADAVAIQFVANRARRAIEELREPNEGAPGGSVTVSVGVACRLVTMGDDLKSLLQQADMALYAAKHGGRNRVATAEPTVMAQVD